MNTCSNRLYAARSLTLLVILIPYLIRVKLYSAFKAVALESVADAMSGDIKSPCDEQTGLDDKQII